jgi:nucleoside-diphosphate kinase
LNIPAAQTAGSFGSLLNGHPKITDVKEGSTAMKAHPLLGEISMEQTLSLIKPDGVDRGLVGEIIRRFEGNGIRIVAMKLIRLQKECAQSFYAEHRGKPFYDKLTEFMASGPIVAMVLEGENVIQKNRAIMGATDYREAAIGTIRHDFARDGTKNIVHGSDCAASAAREIPFFFSRLEIHRD